jgi:segregation and condensation protein A
MIDDIKLMTESFDDVVQSDQNASSDLVIDVSGFEGPIDVLLTLARNQKVDITQISILELADQYLFWIAKLQGSNLELAADYLVMAAWLAYLKSRLLIPEMESADEPTGEEMADALQFQMRRLESMQDAGNKIIMKKQLGKDFFKRGDIEKLNYNVVSIFEVSMFELLSAYGEHTHRSNVKTLHIQGLDLFSPDEAIQRLAGMLGKIPEWSLLNQFVPIELRGDLISHSAIASTFVAALQMTKEGKIKIRQDSAFKPIFVKDYIHEVKENLNQEAESINKKEIIS